MKCCVLFTLDKTVDVAEGRPMAVTGYAQSASPQRLVVNNVPGVMEQSEELVQLQPSVCHYQCRHHNHFLQLDRELPYQ